MSLEYWIGGALAVSLLIYLVHELLNP
ncbi:MAG: potassium-transporting ATPase subunit F [bacterium]